MGRATRWNDDQRPARRGRKAGALSAHPDFFRKPLGETIRSRIHAAEALCAQVESLAVAGRLDAARQLMAEVYAILDEATCSAAACEPPADGLAASLDDLRHRARNAETVLKLLE